MGVGIGINRDVVRARTGERNEDGKNTEEFVCPIAEYRRPFTRKTSLTNHLKAHNNKASRPIQEYLKLKASKIVKHTPNGARVIANASANRARKLPPISHLTAAIAGKTGAQPRPLKLSLPPLFPLPKMQCDGPVHGCALPLLCILCDMQNTAAIATTTTATTASVNHVKEEVSDRA